MKFIPFCFCLMLRFRIRCGIPPHSSSPQLLQVPQPSQQRQPNLPRQQQPLPPLLPAHLLPAATPATSQQSGFPEIFKWGSTPSPLPDPYLLLLVCSAETPSGSKHWFRGQEFVDQRPGRPGHLFLSEQG